MLAALVLAAVAATPPPSAEAFYDQAVAAMRDLQQPRYVTYAMEGQSQGLLVRLMVEDHLVWLNMGVRYGGAPVDYGAGMETRWSMRHRTNDYATEILDEMDGRRYVSDRAFFDPTWYGAFRALRDGMLFYQPPEAPVSSYATPTPGPPSDLRTIAVVTVIGSTIYTPQDAGPAVCYNGDDGHAIHLVPKDRNKQHQLTDVVVDLRNMRFCSIRFNASGSGGFTGTVEQHYSDVGGYWLQTDGIITDRVRTLGITVARGTWLYRMTGVGFPPSIPGEVFLTPPDQ